MPKSTNRHTDLPRRAGRHITPAPPNRLPITSDMTITASAPEQALLSVWRRLSRVVGIWLSALRRRHRLRQTVQALEALDDRTLDDIGVQRAKIKSIVLGAAIRNGWH